MKDTFTDSDPSQRPEHRGRRLFKRGTALASLALIGAWFAHNNTEEVDVHAIPAPGYIVRDSNGDIIPIIPPERTVTLATTGTQIPEFYPNYVKSPEAKPGYCQVVDLRLPQRLDYNEVVKGSRTEFALSTSEYQQLSSEVLNAKSIKEVQQLVVPILVNLGIKPEFDAPIDPRYIPYPKVANTQENMQQYTEGMRSFLEALTVMPRDMVTYAKSINFLNTSRFGGTVDKSGKEHWAAGTFNSGGDVVTFAMLSTSTEVVIHEFAHGMHAKACENFTDAQLEQEYNKAITYLRKSDRTERLEKQFWDKPHTPDDEDAYNAYINQGRLSGFPTDYSRTNYIELMAEITMDIMNRRGLFSDAVTSLEQQETAARLKEMITERLQTAMPHVDVPAFLEYLTDYNQTQPSVLEPHDAIAKRISPFDGTYAYYKNVNGHNDEAPEDWKLTPAIMVKGQNGMPDQYVYAYENSKEGSIDIQINIPKVYGDDTRNMLAQAAERFIRSTPGYDDVKIRTFDFGSLTGEIGNGVEITAYKAR